MSQFYDQLVEALTSGEELARALAGATQGVMQVATSRPQNQTYKPGGNDQDHRHHQQ